MIMSANRQDAWTEDEDLLLAEVVLRYIREGGTQLQAFEEVGKRLSRTAAACGFRWNSYVRKKYQSGIELAKKQRKERKKLVQGETSLPKKEEEQHLLTPNDEDKQVITLHEMIRLITELYKTAEEKAGQENEINKLTNKIKELEKEIADLRKENEKINKEREMIEEDYKALIEIMERARKMVVLQEEDRQQKVKFQMDKNGNLERINK